MDELEGQDHGRTNPVGAGVHLVVRSHGPGLGAWSRNRAAPSPAIARTLLRRARRPTSLESAREGSGRSTGLL